MEPFIGEIMCWPIGFIPKGWAECAGQLLAIAQNQALFSLLGTTYGGNGQTTFALPNLQGRVPLGSGQAPDGAQYTLGQVGGSASVTLIASQMPLHNHLVGCNGTTAVDASPAFFAPTAQYANGANGAMAASGVAGGSQPHDNTMPSLVLVWCIALTGIYPSRN